MRVRSSPSRSRTRCSDLRSRCSRPASSAISPSGNSSPQRRLFLALGLWLDRRAPRPQPWTSLAAAVVAVPVVLLPVRVLSNDLTAHNSFMTVPLAKLQEHTSASILQTGYALLAAALVAVFVLVPRRAAPALLGVVAVGLLTASGFATAEVTRLSRKERASVFSGADPEWVDRTADGPVTVYATGERTATDVWQHAFWNDRIARSSPSQVRGGPASRRRMPSRTGGERPRSGLPVRANLVLTSPSLTLQGERVGGIPTSIDQPGLNLWRTDGPVRLLTATRGVLPNGDLVGPATVRVYACGPGTLELTLIGKQERLFESAGRRPAAHADDPFRAGRPSLAARPAGRER